eukprot:scaffold2527_cov185-Skeletonema_menzelii.AAC.22
MRRSYWYVRPSIQALGLTALSTQHLGSRHHSIISAYLFHPMSVHAQLVRHSLSSTRASKDSNNFIDIADTGTF